MRRTTESQRLREALILPVSVSLWFVNVMVILGIETSCDETAAALVEETGDPGRPWRVRSSIVASQVDIHREWGGIVPELSARQHVRDICGVVERALADAGTDAYDAIAVTPAP